MVREPEIGWGRRTINGIPDSLGYVLYSSVAMPMFDKPSRTVGCRRERQVEFVDHGPILGAKCRLDHTEHSGEVVVAENAIHGTEQFRLDHPGVLSQPEVVVLGVWTLGLMLAVDALDVAYCLGADAHHFPTTILCKTEQCSCGSKLIRRWHGHITDFSVSTESFMVVSFRKYQIFFGLVMPSGVVFLISTSRSSRAIQLTSPLRSGMASLISESVGLYGKYRSMVVSLGTME